MTAESTSAPNGRMLYEPAKPDVRLSALEERVLAKWDAERTFERSLAASASQRPYAFYDGPPFATGLPHYGNLLAGVLKDIVPRYWTMRGYHVARRFGWDCHGLPVEYEISKKLKIESNRQILAMGIDRLERVLVLRQLRQHRGVRPGGHRRALAEHPRPVDPVPAEQPHREHQPRDGGVPAL